MHKWLLFFLSYFLFINSGFSMPGPYEGNEPNVQALWHFDQSSNSGDAYKDVSGNYELVEYGTPNIKDVQSLFGFGRAISGFTSTGALECVTLPDSPNQTFEAWVKWENEDYLPQNMSLTQVLVAKAVSSTFSVRFYFVANELTLEIRDGDGATQIRSVSVPVLAEKGTWYHVAYTIETSDFDGQQDIVDVQVKLYFNNEHNVNLSPSPVTEAIFEDFAFRANGWRFRLGKRYGTSNDHFRGLIDEVRYTNTVLDTFETFQKGDISRYRGKKSFFVGHDLHATGLPDLSQYNITTVPRFSWFKSFWKQGADINSDFPNELRVKEQASNPGLEHKLYYLDVEHLPTSYTDSSDDQLASIQKMASIIDWVHKEKPGLRVGYYGEMPQRVYWQRSGVSGEAWRQRNELYSNLARHVDVIYPSIYTFYPDQDGWVDYAIDNLKEAKKYNKPVYAFIWPVYHDSTANAGQLVPGDYWRKQLETIYKHADGIVIWSGFNNAEWSTVADDQDPNNWWYQTLDFMRDKGLLD